MKEFSLKYGCNPNQSSARIFHAQGDELPIEILSGRPGYINLLDAFNAWQLVKELHQASGKIAATSFKHVSPAGAALEKELSEEERRLYFVDEEQVSPVASAYIRARGADRLSSFGDWVAVSSEVDASLANYLKKEVSDGIIAPGYSEEALAILQAKKGGKYNVLKIDPSYHCPRLERKDVFGITFEQEHNEVLFDKNSFQNIVSENKNITPQMILDMLVGQITLKYTQSNSVCYVKDGMAIGIGAGQQSRIHCTRLAGNKADIWFLRSHPKVQSLSFRKDISRAERDNAIDLYISREESADLLARWQEVFLEKPEVFSEEEKQAYLAQLKDVTLASDAFFPFGDNVDRAARSGVVAIVEAGGSVRDDHVLERANHYGMVVVFTGIRLFHH